MKSDASGFSDRGLSFLLKSAAANRWLIVTAIVGAVSFIAVVAALWRPVSPEQQLLQARMLESTDPRQALSLLEAGAGASHASGPSAQLLRCRVLLKLRHPREADACFRQITRLSECAPDDIVALARAAQSVGSFRLAEQAFEAAGAVVLKSPESLRGFIEVAYELDHRAVTIDLCQAYARLVPDDAFPWLVSAGIHHENSNGPLAIEDYREALRRKLPDSEAARVRYQLVGLLMERGDIPEARQQCDLLLAATVDQASDNLVALLNADLLYREGRPRLSLEVVNRVLERQPDAPVARMIRGFIHFDSGEFALAIEDLLAVVGKDPFNQRAHYKLGQALQRANQSEAAEIHLKRSEELIRLSSEIMVAENLLGNTPGDRELKARLIELNERRGNFKAAAGWRGQLNVAPNDKGKH